MTEKQHPDRVERGWQPDCKSYFTHIPCLGDGRYRHRPRQYGRKAARPGEPIFDPDAETSGQCRQMILEN